MSRHFINKSFLEMRLCQQDMLIDFGKKIVYMRVVRDSWGLFGSCFVEYIVAFGSEDSPT